MDHDWSPKSSRPSKLYRVYRPYQHTTLTRKGLFASNGKLYLHLATQFTLSMQTITEHRNQAPRISPYISTFESLTEAESWALAAEDEFGQPAYMLEIDARHKCMESVKMWKVSDVQEKTGKECGLGGKRDSEWLILYWAPMEAISKVVRSSTDVRIERGLPFPTGAQNPNKVAGPQPPFDETLYAGFWTDHKALDCGCADEKNCAHFEWPTTQPERSLDDE